MLIGQYRVPAVPLPRKKKKINKNNVQKFGVGKIFLYFWKKSHQGCIYLI